MTDIAQPTGPYLPDPEHALVPSGNLSRRMWTSRVMHGLAIGAAGLAVLVLAILIVVTAARGISAISWSFLTGDLATQYGAAGGIGPALVGTLVTSLLSGVISVFLGVLIALFVVEYAPPRIANVIQLFLDLLAGLPAIVVGVFVFTIFVENSGSTGNGIDGSIALSLVMIPLVARSVMESLLRIPGSWRDAAAALGISRWRTVLGVVLPGATAGIVTASLLAVARGAGEAAPLLFTTGSTLSTVNWNPLHGMVTIQTYTLTLLESGSPNALKEAWGASFFLLAVILIINVGARVMLRRGERKRGL